MESKKLKTPEKKVKKTNIRSPMAWQTELSRAYSARTKFLELLNPELERRVIEDLLGEVLPRTAQWSFEESSNTPAVNIYLFGIAQKFDGLSTKIRFHRLGGNVYFNVFLGDHTNLNKIKTHEEEHTKTLLMDKRPNITFRTVEDIKIALTSETISYLSELLAHSPELVTPKHLKLVFPNKVFSAVVDMVEEYSHFKISKKEVRKMLRTIYAQYMHLFLEISRLSKILTLQEVILVMRQTDFDNLITELRKRAEIKSRYSRKK
jgi:hypothetical protein